MGKALVIDDSITSRMLVAHWLREEGWQVIEAEEGEEGLQLSREHCPDVVLCDLMMPRCNGYTVCRTIRSQGEGGRRPRIIVMTASDYGADRENAREAGADDYLVKPLNRERLMEILAAVEAGGIRASSREAPTVADETPGPVSVRFWGVRGSLPTPGPETIVYGGNTSCVEVRTDGEIIILDAGSGIRRLGLALSREFEGRPMTLTLLLTHTHWDHIQGFPFFVPAYKTENRLRILGAEGARSGLEKTLSSQMESPYFPISMRQMPGNIVIEELKDMRAMVGPVEVSSFFLHHPGICVGYRLAMRGGSIAYLTDHEPFERFMKLSGKNSSEEVAYARGEDQKLVDFIDGADVLIIDSQYAADEYSNRVGWGHGCVDDVVAIAIKARVKQLFLFHHDPDHDDAFITQMVEHGRRLAREAGSELCVEAARERSEFRIPMPIVDRNAGPGVVGRGLIPGSES